MRLSNVQHTFQLYIQLVFELFIYSSVFIVTFKSKANILNGLLREAQCHVWYLYVADSSMIFLFVSLFKLNTLLKSILIAAFRVFNVCVCVSVFSCVLRRDYNLGIVKYLTGRPTSPATWTITLLFVSQSHNCDAHFSYKS